MTPRELVLGDGQAGALGQTGPHGLPALDVAVDDVEGLVAGVRGGRGPEVEFGVKPGVGEAVEFDIEFGGTREDEGGVEFFGHGGVEAEGGGEVHEVSYSFISISMCVTWVYTLSGIYR